MWSRFAGLEVSVVMVMMMLGVSILFWCGVRVGYLLNNPLWREIWWYEVRRLLYAVGIVSMLGVGLTAVAVLLE